MHNFTEVHLLEPNASEQRAWRQPPSLSVHDDTQFKIRDFVPPEDHVDIVITWSCEDIEWISQISPKFVPILTVVLLQKVDKEWEKKVPKCHTQVPKTPFNVSVVRLRNRGRDIHSPFIFIKNNYRTLAGHTLFMQADQHWFLRWSPPIAPNPELKVRHFENNAEAVNDFVSMALRRRARFIPLTPYAKKAEEDEVPMLYADRESNIDISVQDSIIQQERKYVFTFDNGANDVYNTAREMYSILFGGSPCDAPSSSPLLGVTFVPGFQFIVSRHALWRQPLRIWASMADLTLECPNIGYAIERLSLQLFDSDKNISDPEAWTKVSFCNLDEAYFSVPWDVYKSAEFWRRQWGCEPLSDFLLSRSRHRK
jgi:hypothetical protein